MHIWSADRIEAMPEPRRASRREPQCDSRAPNADDQRWFCERKLNHSGKHMAWRDLETGELWPNGEWE